MVTSIFLWGVSGCIWINILTHEPWGFIKCSAFMMYTNAHCWSKLFNISLITFHVHFTMTDTLGRLRLVGKHYIFRPSCTTDNVRQNNTKRTGAVPRTLNFTVVELYSYVILQTLSRTYISAHVYLSWVQVYCNVNIWSSYFMCSKHLSCLCSLQTFLDLSCLGIVVDINHIAQLYSPWV